MSEYFLITVHMFGTVTVLMVPMAYTETGDSAYRGGESLTDDNMGVFPGLDWDCKAETEVTVSISLNRHYSFCNAKGVTLA